MRVVTLFPVLLLVVALAGCPGGHAGAGDSCDRHSDCEATLQCAQRMCVPRCQRAPDCGDGYSCNSDGLCTAADGQDGDPCTSEVDCAAGLSCTIEGSRIDDNKRLIASCSQQHGGAPSGSACTADGDCRNGTCALGRCTDLCDETRDCAAGTSCMVIPRVEARGALFDGCFVSNGTVSWDIPMRGPTDEILLPVPSAAQHAALVMSVEDQGQRVGVTSVFSPPGLLQYRPCPSLTQTDCSPEQQHQQYFANAVRHRREPGTAVLAMPSSPSTPLETGAYTVVVSSFQNTGATGAATPSVKAVLRLGPAVILDLHFHFLDLDKHPCEDAYNGAKLDATSAQSETRFQTDFIGHLRTIFANGGVALGAVTYQNVDNHPELDGLDMSDAPALLSLGTYTGGINVFFVRSLSPVGIQAFGPGPGPAGLGGTAKSGIIVGVDTLCYRSWPQLARLTAHEIARYMGLYHNVEAGLTTTNNLRDPIDDSDDTPDNLMFYSEFGGAVLSPGQRDILTRSPVLR